MSLREALHVRPGTQCPGLGKQGVASMLRAGDRAVGGSNYCQFGLCTELFENKQGCLTMEFVNLYYRLVPKRLK